MAGDVVNIKVCSPFKLRSGLTVKAPANRQMPIASVVTFYDLIK